METDASNRLVQMLLLAMFATSGCAPGEPPQRPNVVVILLDTLRPDYLGFHGYEKEMAPFLARLASESVVFERAFSTSSWTAPSTSSLFTSLYPPQHGVVEGFMMHHVRTKKRQEAGKETIPLNRLPTDRALLPEVFQSMGYRTFGLATNVNIGDEIGFSRGFDRFELIRKSSAGVVLERVEEWKEGILASEAFFLYLHLNDVHIPYHLREPYYEKQEGKLEDRRARYLSELGYADAHIRQIYETLGLGEETVIVVLSDHGEEFRDHGGLEHGARLYIELNRILMMFHAPSMKLEPRRISTTNVSLIDVLPTLLDLVDGKPVGDEEGVSLVPLLKNGGGSQELAKALRRRILFAHRVGSGDPQRELWAAIHRYWKLIEQPDGRRELYDHRADPREKRNVYRRHRDVPGARLVAILEEFKDREVRESPEAVQVELDDELKETLKSLGYVNQ